MIDRCIVCHVKCVEQKDFQRVPQLCANCVQKAELMATHQSPRPSVAHSTDMMAALELTFKKRFGAA